jgi:hypothetical protein
MRRLQQRQHYLLRLTGAGKTRVPLEFDEGSPTSRVRVRLQFLRLEYGVGYRNFQGGSRDFRCFKS